MIIRNLSTAVLGFVSGKFDMTFPYALTAPLLNDVNSRIPQAICEMSPEGVSRTLTINHRLPPFDKRELRRWR
jgi:peptide/nickel transport system substrate-binding protein